jgi:glycosyltransferase involved in cell wall biosynthesis
MTDHFLADGVQVRKSLVERDHIPADKVSVFYHGVNAIEMRRDERDRVKARNLLGIANGEVAVGHVGRFVPMKGQEYLLQAFAMTAQTVPDVKLVLVGDGDLRENLQFLTNTLGLDSRVVFTGFRDDLHALYSAFDMYVQSSVEGGGETISFAVQQALAYELPVVVTNVADVVENVREGVNGFVVPDRNASALAGKLTVLAQDEHLRRAMGVESRKYLLERFTTEHMVESIEQTYRRVLAGKSAA